MIINMSNIIVLLPLFLLPLPFTLLVSLVCFNAPFGLPILEPMTAPLSWTVNSSTYWRAMPLRMQVTEQVDSYLFIFMHTFAYFSPPSGQQVLFSMNSISPAECYYIESSLNRIFFEFVATLQVHLQIQEKTFVRLLEFFGSGSLPLRVKFPGYVSTFASALYLQNFTVYLLRRATI